MSDANHPTDARIRHLARALIDEGLLDDLLLPDRGGEVQPEAAEQEEAGEGADGPGDRAFEARWRSSVERIGDQMRSVVPLSKRIRSSFVFSDQSVRGPMLERLRESVARSLAGRYQVEYSLGGSGDATGVVGCDHRRELSRRVPSVDEIDLALDKLADELFERGVSHGAICFISPIDSNMSCALAHELMVRIGRKMAVQGRPLLLSHEPALLVPICQTDDGAAPEIKPHVSEGETAIAASLQFTYGGEALHRALAVVLFQTIDVGDMASAITSAVRRMGASESIACALLERDEQLDDGRFFMPRTRAFCESELMLERSETDERRAAPPRSNVRSASELREEDPTWLERDGAPGSDDFWRTRGRSEGRFGPE